MKSSISPKPLWSLAVGVALALSAMTIAAQNSAAFTATPAAHTTSPAASSVSQKAGQLSLGVADVLKLSQAKVADDTIIAFISNSGKSYGLNAEQLFYLRQQGVAEPVLRAMLNKPSAQLAVPMPIAPTAHTANSTAGTKKPVSRDDSTPVKGATLLMSSTAKTEPVPTKVQTIPVTPYYYPYHYWYPPVSFSFGWGGVWGWGYHGGGYHAGGGYHGGGGHGGGSSHH